MKTTETKSSTHSQQQQSTETQSASQEQEHAFFSEQAPETTPFFSSSAFPTIQAKQNNSRSLFFQPSQTLTIQRKCAACKTEEKQTSPMQVQRMPAFESEGEAPVQAKLTIGQPNDRYEQEADRVAARVVSAPTTAVQRSVSPLSSFKQANYLQRKGGADAASAEFEQRLQGTKSGGTALNEEVRGFMEPRFGADFSQVRVHTDTTAVHLNKEIGAKAFTHGNDIYFNSGKYTPNSTDGKELLAHELTHVVQQSDRSIGLVQKQSNGEDASITIIINALEGITSANDSAIILAEFRSKSTSKMRAILRGLKHKASEHSETANGMLDWLFSDMTAEDSATLRSLLIRSGVHSEINRIVISELDSLLSGYTSESDSKEIYAILGQYTGGGLENLLRTLATRENISGTELGKWIFSDMDRVNAERLRIHFLTLGAKNAVDYAADFTATKIVNLLSGYTSHADSSSILHNFRRTPEPRRPAVQERLETKSQAIWSQSASDVLMEDMDRTGYEAIRALSGIKIRAYDYTPTWYEKAISWTEWGLVVGEWVVCGLVGVVTGIIGVVWDILRSLVDIVVALWHLLWSLVYFMTRGAVGSKNWLKVKQFFLGVGKIFTDPVAIWDQYWEMIGLEYQTIEGPLTDCRRAEFIARKFTQAVLNIALIFLAGYGIAKVVQAVSRLRLLSGGVRNALRLVRLGGHSVDDVARLETLLASPKVTSASELEALLSHARISKASEIQALLIDSNKVKNAAELKTILDHSKITKLEQLTQLLEKTASADTLVQLLDKVDNADQLIRLVSEIEDVRKIDRILHSLDKFQHLKKLLNSDEGIKALKTIEEVTHLGFRELMSDMSLLLHVEQVLAQGVSSDGLIKILKNIVGIISSESPTFNLKNFLEGLASAGNLKIPQYSEIVASLMSKDSQFSQMVDVLCYTTAKDRWNFFDEIYNARVLGKIRKLPRGFLNNEEFISLSDEIRTLLKRVGSDFDIRIQGSSLIELPGIPKDLDLGIMMNSTDFLNTLKTSEEYTKAIFQFSEGVGGKMPKNYGASITNEKLLHFIETVRKFGRGKKLPNGATVNGNMVSAVRAFDNGLITANKFLAKSELRQLSALEKSSRFKELELSIVKIGGSYDRKPFLSLHSSSQ